MMKIKELIDKLKGLNQEFDVYVTDWNEGYLPDREVTCFKVDKRFKRIVIEEQDEPKS